MISVTESELFLRLAALGDPRKKVARPEKAGVPSDSHPELTHEHVPELIRIARLWAEWSDNDFHRLGDLAFASIHAWRALGQLRAAEAVAPLLGSLNQLNEQLDDWNLDELPKIFGKIGRPAMGLLTSFLCDRTNQVYARICAASGLREIGEQDRGARLAAVSALSRVLSDFADEDPALIGLVIGSLMALKGVEAAALIERAFAAGSVDTQITGTWDSVRMELGIEGLGLVQPRHDEDDRDEIAIHRPSGARSQPAVQFDAGDPNEWISRKPRRRRRRRR